MKSFRRWLSLLLAAVMILSGQTAWAVSAAAADTETLQLRRGGLLAFGRVRGLPARCRSIRDQYFPSAFRDHRKTRTLLRCGFL